MGYAINLDPQPYGNRSKRRIFKNELISQWKEYSRDITKISIETWFHEIKNYQRNVLTTIHNYRIKIQQHSYCACGDIGNISHIYFECAITNVLSRRTEKASKCHANLIKCS